MSDLDAECPRCRGKGLPKATPQPTQPLPQSQSTLPMPVQPSSFPAPQSDHLPQQYQAPNVTTNVMVVNEERTSGYGTASLVLAVASLFLFCIPGLPIFTSGLAMVLGMVAVGAKHKDAGMGLAGAIVGGLVVAVSIIILLSFGAAMNDFNKTINTMATPVPTRRP